MLDPRAEEHEIGAVAQHYASRTRAALTSVDRKVSRTVCVTRAPMAVDELAGMLNDMAKACGARPVDNDVSLSGRIGRMVDPAWWRRNLRRGLLRENEAIEHAQGRVRRAGECYVSDFAVKRLGQRAKANRATLERCEVVNGDGEAFNLAEVADASVSNPRLRRSELMVRCRGFEETAKFMGHEAVLLTITCPSRFHRFNSQGKPNEKWQDATPRDGQKYLREVWAKIRAAWHRAGHAPYGFRVAEPHHDGCPHWHILLFAPGDQVGWFEPRRFVADRDDHGAGLVGIAGALALADCAGEAGAVRHRFTCKRIDPNKGGATSYIAKYIAKNIDGQTEAGESVGLDYASGKSATTAAKRVRSWASVHGIRQFQQIGGPSVTVWRELRRLGKGEKGWQQLDLFEGPRAAADRAMWALFWVLQGGPDVPRSELTLKPFYSAESTGKYGDAVERVKGVAANTGDELVTRLHVWTVQRAGLADVNAVEGARLWERGMRASEFGIWYFRHLAERSAAPWTGVNNCTEPASEDEDAALYLDYLRGGGGQPFEEPTNESSNTGRFGRSSGPDRRNQGGTAGTL